MEKNTSPFIYDLSGERYSDVTIQTNIGQILIGRVVSFSVASKEKATYYPTPTEIAFIEKANQQKYWEKANQCRFEFSEFPRDVKLINLNEIKEMVIRPTFLDPNKP